MLYDIRFGHLRCLGDLYLFPNEVTCKSPFTEGLLTQNPKCRRQLRERLKAGRGKADGIGDSLVYRSPHICTGMGMHSNLHLRASLFLRRARRFVKLYSILVARERDLCFTVILSPRETIHVLHPWFGFIWSHLSHPSKPWRSKMLRLFLFLTYPPWN